MAIRNLSDISVDNDITLSGSYQIDGIDIINTSSTYTQIRNPEGDRCIFLGDSADPTTYFDNTGFYFRSAGGNSNYLVIGSGGATFENRVDIKDDLRIRGAGGNPSQGIVRFYTDSTNKLNIDTGNTGSNITIIDSLGNATFAGKIASVKELINVNSANGTRSGGFEVQDDGDLFIGTATTAGNIVLETGNTTNGLPSTGTARLTINSTNASFSTNVMPTAENSYNIGSSSLRWEDLYVDDGFIRDAYIDTNIYHNGDTDTYINFTTDTIKLSTAGGIGFEQDSNRDINSPDRLYMRQTQFGYSSAYKVVQFGNAAATSAISLGYNPSGNANGGFSGNEILIPNNIRILAPNAADNQFYGVMMFSSNDKLLIGSSNYLIDSNYIMAMDPATQRVGIGTDSPTAKLDVRKSGTTAAHGDTDLFVGDSGSASSTSQVQIHGGTSGFSNLYFSDASAYNVGGFIYNHTSNYLATNVNGSQRMRIDSGGSIIIGDGATSGTPASDYRSLEIGRQGNTITGAPWKSNLYFSTNATVTAGSTAFTYRYASAAPTQMTMENGVFTWSNAAAGTVGNTISFTERMRITSDGNVGIGVTNPSFKTHIRGGSNTEETVLKLDKSSYGDTGGHTTILGFGNEPAGWAKGGIGYERTASYDRGKMHFLQENTGNSDTVTLADSVMTIQPDGNVGIGTTSPTTKFQVGGGSANVLQKIWGSGTAGIQIFTNSPSTGTKIIALEQYFSNEGYLGLYYNGTEKVRLRANDTSFFTGGRVGIGTTATPGRMLEVNGGSNNDGGIRLETTSTATNFWSGIEMKTPNATSFIYVSSGDSAGTIKFVPAGSIKASLNATSFICAGDVVAFGSPSDITLKENIKPIKSALEKVTKLQGVTFDWKESDSILEIKEDIGFVAQDVQKVLPTLVRKNDNGKLSLREKGIVPILVEAIKELKAEIEELKKSK